MMESIKYGDIILVNLNPVKNEEISKIRPCLVFSNDVLNSKSPFFIIIPITGNIEKSLSWHVIIKKSKTNNLIKDSKILPEQIRSVSQKRFVKKLGILEVQYLKELEIKISFILNLREDF